MLATGHASSHPATHNLGTKFCSGLCLSLIVFFLPLAQAHAQSLDRNKRISQYGHSSWRVQDGIVGADPILTQTADGYIWDATVIHGHWKSFVSAPGMITDFIADSIVEPAFYQTIWFKTLLAISIAALLWTLYYLRLMRDARLRVRDLRQRTADATDLADRLTKLGRELAKDHTANFTLSIVGEPRVLESTVQDEACRIAGEALSNAFRHASASTIETEVTYDSSALRIRVRDNGVGIDKVILASGQSGHWGLAGMRERARAIRTELNLWSRDAAGTEVELVIPASIAYPRE